jgi:EthD domain
MAPDSDRTSRPGLLLLISRSDPAAATPVDLKPALRALGRDAEVVQAAQRSDFTSAKRDEYGHVIAMTPSDVDVLVEAQYPDRGARDRAVVMAGDRLRDLSGIEWRFVPGDVHDVIPGSGAVTVAFFAARRRELTRPQFHDYWLNHHALIAQQVPNGPGYRQLHVLGEATDLGSDAGEGRRLELDQWDGVTTMKYASYDVLAATRVSATVAVTAFLDERTFIDHARSSMAFFDAVDL